MASMLVPANFGLRHIGVPSHGDLTFDLGVGIEKIKADSRILSLNSPVINRLTNTLGMKTLDADDFSKEAVDCFIEACYTGRVDELNKGNFRDVNKMGHAFKVCWLSERCKEYYDQLVKSLGSGHNTSDVLFAVDEALYVVRAIKKNDFYDMIVKRLISFSALHRNKFIRQFLVDLSASSKQQLDLCLAVVGFDVSLLTELLEKHLEDNGYGSFNENCKYLLYSIGSKSFDGKPFDVYSKLFDALENVECSTNEDYKLLVYLYKQKSKQLQNSLWPNNLNNHSFCDYFGGHDMSGEIMIENLGSCSKVNSLYSFFDGLLTAVFCSRSSLPKDYNCGPDFLQTIIDIKENRGWDKISLKYLQKLYSRRRRCIDFVNTIMNCDDLVSSEVELTSTTICEYSASEFTKFIFCSGKAFMFTVDVEHFALTIEPADDYREPDDFSAKWFSLGQQYHLHFVLEILYQDDNKSEEKWLMFPLTWFGPPTCDKTGKYWNWGNARFHDMRDARWESKKMVERGNICVSGHGYRPTTEEDFHIITGTTICRLLAIKIS